MTRNELFVVALSATSGVFASICLSVLGAQPVQAQSARLGVTDVMRYAIVGDPGSVDWTGFYPKVGVSSPDGRKVATIVRSGNVERQTNDASLLIYSTDELMTRPTPRIVARFSSGTNGQPIGLIRWTADSESLFFAATAGKELPQLYRVGIDDKSLIKIGDQRTETLWYDITPTGDRLVMIARHPGPTPYEDPECLERGCRVTEDRIYAAEHIPRQPQGNEPFPVTVHDLHTGRSRSIGGLGKEMGVDFCPDSFTGGLSPNGRFGVRICHMLSAPLWWDEYDASFNDYKGKNVFTTLFLIDLDEGVYRPLTGAPSFTAFRVDPLWIDGGKTLILAGDVQPLTGTNARERAHRASSLAVMSIDPIARTIQRIADLGSHTHHVQRSYWDERSQILTIESLDRDNNRLPLVAWRRKSARWVSVANPKPIDRQDLDRVQLVLDQSVNARPVLIAQDRVTGARAKVLDPNTWLDNFKLGRVEEVSFKATGDCVWTGGLYYPPDYVAGKRYPLLLQTHGFKAGEFSLTGFSRNIAAQPIASRDIVVLQISDCEDETVMTPQEYKTFRAGYEGAIDYLDSRGVIDRKRVGIQGWSRTGTLMGYNLTHSNYSFAAAAFTDSGDFGWVYYMMAGAPRDLEPNFGAAPFGKGLEPWLESSPTFNLERVRTPIFIWHTGAWDGGLTNLWDWYSGLKRLNKPIEYWFLPQGTHNVYQIGQRIRTNQLLVDWFDFWLNDHEDPQAAKADQYQRWREMRTQQNEVLKTPRPPLLDWSATPVPGT